MHFRKPVFIAILMSFCYCLAEDVSAQKKEYYLYIGTYTFATSEGIYIYHLDNKTGDITPVSIAKGFSNPSFLYITPDAKFLYALGGNKGDSVRAFEIDRQTHALRLLNSESLGNGLGTVHLQADRSHKWLIVGNYGIGSICVLPILPDGSLGKLLQNIQLEGKSINPERQDKPHVHSINIAPNNTDVFVPDLGTDKIMYYVLDTLSGKLNPGEPAFTQVTPGSGPRHFAFHPNGEFAYLIQEMASTITAYRYGKGKLDSIQTVPNLPDSFTGRKWSADIHVSPDGKFLYGSNRAHESLVIFRINKKTGKLSLVGHQPVYGKTPRNFVIDPTGNFILVANQDSDNITIFRRNKKTGRLSYLNKEIRVSMPVCLQFSR